MILLIMSQRSGTVSPSYAGKKITGLNRNKAYQVLNNGIGDNIFQRTDQRGQYELGGAAADLLARAVAKGLIAQDDIEAARPQPK